jgi:hypothetical protein
MSQKCLFEDMDLGGYGWNWYLILSLYTASLSQASGTHTLACERDAVHVGPTYL